MVSHQRIEALEGCIFCSWSFPRDVRSFLISGLRTAIELRDLPKLHFSVGIDDAPRSFVCLLSRLSVQNGLTRKHLIRGGKLPFTNYTPLLPEDSHLQQARIAGTLANSFPTTPRCSTHALLRQLFLQGWHVGQPSSVEPWIISSLA
jgi:hypothetical protein